MNQTQHDRRITPIRRDLAASRLKGQIDAPRFAEGVRRQVVRSVADLREHPADTTRLETQILFGEAFTAYDVSDGWAWGQAELDSYVGYVEAKALGEPVMAPTHRVRVLRTLLFPSPDIKSAPARPLTLNAKLAVEDQAGRFYKIAGEGYVFAAHAAALGEHDEDWVATAERFLGAPYLWGGKTLNGVDCSGLVQAALESAGVAAPRDSDMQEAALGAPLPPKTPLRRGDLVFWKGHVGVMADAVHLLHANAFHMSVEIEPLDAAIARSGALSDPVTSIRRL
ncbi:MAG TPA: NlpC/P60 family protein [Caulobacterales bacterium]|nr:NlpC/P60 family protein [Caulobacterales bacterium]